ncbi:hypothetical protein PVAND_001045 [Polypedilum vanderplanki]|uniref:GB1/RHD3-type G domain-containing protein n=1 Tax=Polypedilum vanderplanki TaxID=319348 RepID=A0A9J6BMC7_POLVA|nr:hypothetical protein PVAND_001045 [Polypedilum vanderplanki]
MEKSTQNHPFGKAEILLKFTQNDEIEFFDEPLKKIFQHPHVVNRQIVAFSTIGSYRRGKSFFLDYCLRFLYANYQSINFPNNQLSNKKNWMGLPDEPLTGFSWRAGFARDTSGILIWNDVFLYTVPNTGENIAIIVMDTQGLFDNQTTVVNNSRIFALGSLFSSIQVLNLNGVVEENQLQYLQFATEYAKLAMKENENFGKPFQNLMFLIRDWAYITDYTYGIEGGEGYMKRFLGETSSNKEIKSVREHIHNSFENLGCFLLPYPGEFVSGRSGQYDGNWRLMKPEFKIELEILIQYLLSPNRLIVKKINGMTLNGAKYLEFMRIYLNIFKSTDLPKPKTLLEASIEVQMNSIADECFHKYIEQISLQKIDNLNDIYNVHRQCKILAFNLFKNSKKISNFKYEIKYKEILDERIEEFYTNWSEKEADKLRKEQEKIRIEQEKFRKAQEEERERKFNEKLEAERKQTEILFQMMQNQMKNEQIKIDERIAIEESRKERERLEELIGEFDPLAEKFFGLSAGPIVKAGVQMSANDAVFTGINLGDSVVKVGIEADNSEVFTGLNVGSAAKLGVNASSEDKELFGGLDVAGNKIGASVGFDKGVSAGVELGPVGKVGAGVSFDKGVAAGVELGPVGKVGFGIKKTDSNAVRVGLDLGFLGNVGINFPKFKK